MCECSTQRWVTLLDRDREKGGEARTESKQRRTASRRTLWEGFEHDSHGEKGSETLLLVKKRHAEWRDRRCKTEQLNESAFRGRHGLWNLQGKQFEMKWRRFELSHIQAAPAVRYRGAENDWPSATPGIHHCWGSGPNQGWFNRARRAGGQAGISGCFPNPSQPKALSQEGRRGTGSPRALPVSDDLH